MAGMLCRQRPALVCASFPPYHSANTHLLTAGVTLLVTSAVAAVNTNATLPTRSPYIPISDSHTSTCRSVLPAAL